MQLLNMFYLYGYYSRKRKQTSGRDFVSANNKLASEPIGFALLRLFIIDFSFVFLWARISIFVQQLLLLLQQQQQDENLQDINTYKHRLLNFSISLSVCLFVCLFIMEIAITIITFEWIARSIASPNHYRLAKEVEITFYWCHIEFNFKPRAPIRLFVGSFE